MAMPAGIETAVCNEDDYLFSIIGEAAVITGYTGHDPAIITPTVLDGYPVVGINTQAFQDNTEIMSVYISSGVTVIGDEAFTGCTALVEITFPNGLEEVGQSTFSGCTAIAAIELPDSVTSIGYHAFAGCVALYSFTYPRSLNFTGSEIFKSCYELTYMAVPEGVDSLPAYVFNGCDNFTTIALPATLASIGDYAFVGCSELINLEIPDGTLVSDNAFDADEEGSLSTIIPSEISDPADGADSVELQASGFEFSSLSGRVIDTNGQGVNGVSVQIYNLDENNVLTLCVTNSSGSWTSAESDVIAGYTYFVRYYKTGYRFSKNDIECVANSGGTTVAAVIATKLDIGNLVCNESDYAYTTTNEKVTITKYNGSDTAILLPSTLGGYPVESVGNSAFAKNTGLETVCISENVTSIGSWAFENCTSLRAVYFPNGMITINSSAFSGCTSLTAVDLPNGLKVINSSAFAGCTGLTGMEIPDSVTTIGGSAFSGCANLESIQLPVSWSTAGSGIFNNCPKLTTITLPEGMTTLPGSAFANANYLEAVVLPSTLATIGNWAFENCAVMDAINFPNGLTTINSSAFSGCTSLKAVNLPNGLKTINSSAFANCTGLTSIEIPDSVTTIGGSAFSGCANLESIQLPVSWSSASGGIFNNCRKLTAITLPEGMTTLPGSAFENANYLKAVVLPGTLTTIGNWAFENCAVMDAINFPNGLTTINSGAFSGCTSLKAVNLPNGLKTINSSAFANCTGLTGMEIPDSVTTIGGSAFSGCANLESIQLPVNWSSASGGIFNNCRKLTAITLPEGMTTLPGSAFENANYLKAVVLPSTLTTIGSWAFENCVVMDTINFPDGLTTINNGAFSGCSNLTTADLPNSVKTMGSSVFSGCTKLSSFSYPTALNSTGGSIFNNCAKLTSITIPEGVTAIPNSAFANANYLRNVSLPGTLTKLGNYAFENCVQLRYVTLPNATSSIGNSAFSGCSQLRYAMITSPTCAVGNYAFDNCPKMFLYCKWVSDATLYAIKNGVDFQLLASDESDYSGYAVDMANTNFYTSSEIAVVDSYIPMTLNYNIPDSVFNSLSNRKITITFSQSLELLENSVTMNGSALTYYDYSNDALTINVTEKSGTIQFYAIPIEAGIIAAYAQFSYAQSNSRKADTIGIIYLDVPLLKLNVPSQTSRTSFDVTGVTSANKTVELNINGTQVGTATAKKNGTFSTKVTIPAAPVSGTSYTVTGKLQNDSSVASSGTVVYQVGAPTLTQFDMYYYGPTLKMLDLLNTDGTRLTNSIYPNHPFKFVVKFDNCDSIGKVYIASTRNGITNKMQAYPTSTTGEFIAEGYFDGTDTSYIPGTINVYYTSTLSETEVLKDLSMDDLPEYWQNSTQTVITDTEDEYVSEISFDDGWSLTFETRNTSVDELRAELLGETVLLQSHDYAQSAQLMDAEAIRAAFEAFIKDTVKSSAKKIVTNGIDAIIINDEEHSGIQYIIFEPVTSTIQKTTISYAAATVPYTLSHIIDKADPLTWKDCTTAAKIIYGEVTAYEKFKNYSVNVDNARSEIQASLYLTATQKKDALEKVDQVEWCYTALTALRMTQPFISAAIKYSGHPFISLLFDVGSSVLFDLAENYLDNSLGYYAAGGQGSYLKWLIDPSGYVYDTDNGERIEGVIATAYYIPYDENDFDFWNKPPTLSQYGTVWDASEYSQQNPLITDAEGNYAWEVPEGWWRVHYEKDGYEEIWSDWMTVPPLQTNVNIGMVSTTPSEYSIKLLESTATSTTLSLTNQTAASLSVRFVIAAYDRDGKMVGVNTVDKTLNVSGDVSLTVSYAASAKVSSVKAFVLMPNTMVPLRSVWSRQVSG